jgi:hypothetical protein
MSRLIYLSRGLSAIVDDADYEWLNQWKWYCNSAGYAVREQYLGGGRKNRVRKTVAMHRLILCTAPNEVDHRDLNTLNNQRSNLRAATRSGNNQNKGPQSNSTTGHKDVFWDKSRLKWLVKINNKHIGRYDVLRDAIEARDRAIVILHGEFART